MNIIELSSGNMIPIEVLPVHESDFKSITKKRYFFNWRTEKAFEILKLIIRGEHEILGLISFERIPNECRIHIRLLTVSVENKGDHKKYDKIAGNLIAYVAKIAVMDYAELACISLTPKSALVNHYMEKYQMNITGKTLSLEVPEILHVINQYDNDEY